MDSGRSILPTQVVTGTETELLSAWRSYPDFYSLAHTVRTLRAHGAADFWDRLDEALGPHRRTDPEGLRTEARVLGRFLTTVLEELKHSDVGVRSEHVKKHWKDLACMWRQAARFCRCSAGQKFCVKERGARLARERVLDPETATTVTNRFFKASGTSVILDLMAVKKQHLSIISPTDASARPTQVLADFVREPTTYLVVGVEDIDGDESERHGEPPASTPEELENRDSISGVERCGRSISCPPADRMIGAKVGHPMKWATRESLLQPTPRSLVGL